MSITPSGRGRFGARGNGDDDDDNDDDNDDSDDDDDALRDKVITHCPPKILSDMCGALYQLIFYFPAQNN